MTPDQLIEGAGQCVRCAYCLPHCPTYALAINEAESPRGRLAMMAGLAAGRLDASSVHRHLDQCLGCGACQRSCPSLVAYEPLLAAARALQLPERNLAWRVSDQLTRALIAELPYWPGIPRLFQLLRRLFQRFLERLLPRLAPMLRHTHAVTSTESCATTRLPTSASRRITLFTGCVGRLVEGDALDAAVRVLGKLGYQVRIPPQQGCCGALDRHAGDVTSQRQREQQNLLAFGEDADETIVFLASGCGARLRDYPAPFAGRVRELCELLTSDPALAELPLSPLPRQVALHTPCTLKNLLRGETAVKQLLDQIPGLEWHALPGEGHCCGGAGGYLLKQPRISERLGQRQLTALRRANAELCATTNTGCSLQLRGQLARAGLPTPVLHPIQLLAWSLEGQPPRDWKTP